MRTKKAFLNTISSLSYQFITIISGLIVPRLILEMYGSTYNGVIASVNQLLSVISILIIGLTGAVRVELYSSLANNDTTQTSKIMKATNQYMRKVAMCIIVYAFILMIVYPYISHNDIPKREIVLLIAIVGFGKFSEYFLGIPYRILLNADQRNYIENFLQISACILHTIVSVIMISLSCSILSVKFVSACIVFASLLLICIYANQKYKLDKDCKVEKGILSKRKDAAIHSIANIVHESSDLVILTIFEDAKVISIYTVYYFVVGQIKKVMGSFTDGLEAAFGNLWAKNEIDNMRHKFKLYEYFMYTLVAIVFSCVGLLIIPFISIYTENVQDINYIKYDLAALITITEAVYCIRQPYVTIIQAAGKYRETRNIAIIEAGTNLVLSLICINFMGINGVIIGTLVANVIRTLYYAYYVAKKIMKIDITSFIKRLIWIIADVLFIIIIGSNIISYIQITNWLNWILAGVIVFGISVIVSFIMSYMFCRKEVYELLYIAKSLFNKKK